MEKGVFSASKMKRVIKFPNTIFAHFCLKSTPEQVTEQLQNTISNTEPMKISSYQGLGPCDIQLPGAEPASAPHTQPCL